MNSGSILSQREYYQLIGITAARKKYEKWNVSVQTENAEMSEHHYKFASWARTLEGIQLMLAHSAILWRHMFLKCWAKTKFSIYKKKQSVIANAVNSLQDPTKPDIVVLYGDGSFPSGGRGRQSVPVKGIKEVVNFHWCFCSRRLTHYFGGNSHVTGTGFSSCSPSGVSKYFI